MEDNNWTSKEILQFPVRDDQLYSVVISDLGNYLEPAFLQPRVYVYNDDGTIKESNNGTPIGRYANSLDYENGQNGIRDNPIYHFFNPSTNVSDKNDAQKIVTMKSRDSSMLVLCVQCGITALLTKSVSFTVYICMS